MFVYRTKFPPIIGDKKCRLREQSFSFREHNLQFSDWDKKHYKPIYSKGLKDFKGVQRRFNKIFTYRETSFYDDYAHHPTEIKAVLNGVRAAYKKEEVICIFQPHRISRLKDLKKEFSLSFKKADSVILCPVYAAGEKIKLGFNYNNFAKDIIKNSKVKLFMVNDQYELAKLIKNTIYGKKIVVGMGAGTISAWMKELPSLI